MRWIPVVAIAAALAALTYALWPVPEEERVRRAVEDAVAAFSAGDVGDCVDAFDLDFVDTSAGRSIDRNTIRTALLAAFVRGARGSEWIARVGDAGVEVTACDEDAGHASAHFSATALRVRSGAEYVDDAEPVWEVAIDAELTRGEDRSWRFVRSTHRTLSGAPPYR